MTIYEQVVEEFGARPVTPSHNGSVDYEGQRKSLKAWQDAVQSSWCERMRSKYADLNDATFELLLDRSYNATIGQGSQGAEMEFENQYRTALEIIRANAKE